MVDWSKLSFKLPTETPVAAPHREHAGSYPILASLVPQGKRRNPGPAVTVLAESELV